MCYLYELLLPYIGPRVVHTVQNAGEVCGMTLLNGELYVLRQRDLEQIEVYSITASALLRRLSVRRLRNFVDIASSDRQSCVFVADAGSACVLRVRSDGSDGQWPLRGYPRALSTTRTSNLLVTCGDGAGRQCSLVELSGESGECLREIALQVERAWHVVPLNDDDDDDDGRFVVSHGFFTTGRVSVVADDGRVVRSSGGGGDVDLNSPYRVAVDSDGFVFVADAGNRRLVLLDRSLRYVRCLLERLHYRPWRLCYDDVARRLYVAETEGPSVVVVQL